MFFGVLNNWWEREREGEREKKGERKCLNAKIKESKIQIKKMFFSGKYVYLFRRLSNLK